MDAGGLYGQHGLLNLPLLLLIIVHFVHFCPYRSI